MKINTNAWNRIRYSLYTPVYDIIGKLFNNFRKQSIENLRIKAGENVLLVGAGTGLDIPYINAEAKVTATDITPSMIAIIKKRAAKSGRAVQAHVMDGQRLSFPDAVFDKVILHLILAVIPDPVKCLKEVERVLKPGGEITVFDKFLPPGKKKTIMRKLLNYLTSTLFSDINRDFDHLVTSTRLSSEEDTAVGLSGNFRIIRLKK